MSESNEQIIEASCTGCKADLSKTDHKEDCPILARQKADHDAREAEQEKILQENLAREAAEKAKKDLEKIKEKTNEENVAKLKEEIAKADTEAKQLRLKNTIIDRIHALAPEEPIDRPHMIKTYSLDELAKIHNQLLKLVKEEKSRKYKVSCPICAQILGKTDTIEQARNLQKEHRKQSHPANYGNLVIGTLLLSFAAAGCYAGYKIFKNYRNKKAKKTGEESQ